MYAIDWQYIIGAAATAVLVFGGFIVVYQWVEVLINYRLTTRKKDS